MSNNSQISNWWYGWTAEALERCLVDHLTLWVADERFKCPDGNNNVAMTAPFIYAGFIPQALLSPEGVGDPPIVPSILIEPHMGEADISPRSPYIISVSLLISLWDDDPTYAGNKDARRLTEKLYLYLLRNRLSLAERYDLKGKPTWKQLKNQRSNYFSYLIELTYDLGESPDDSDDQNADVAVIQEKFKLDRFLRGDQDTL
jgi:hypothetical protein